MQSIKKAYRTWNRHQPDLPTISRRKRAGHFAQQGHHKYPGALGLTKSCVVPIVHAVAHLVASDARNRNPKDVVRYPPPSLKSLPRVRETAVVIRSIRASTEVVIHRNSLGQASRRSISYYRTALEYRGYGLSAWSQHGKDNIASQIAQMAWKLEVQVKSQRFDGSDDINTLQFLHTFQLACDTNKIRTVPSLRLFLFFMKNPIGAVFKAHTGLSNSSHARQEETLTSYWEFYSYLLEMYATDDIIVGPDIDNMNFKPTTGQSAVNYGQELCNLSLRCRPFYKEFLVKETFIAVLPQSSWQIVRGYWSSNKLTLLKKSHVTCYPFPMYSRTLQRRNQYRQVQNGQKRTAVGPATS